MWYPASIKTTYNFGRQEELCSSLPTFAAICFSWLKLKKVQRVSEFDHSTWLKQYPSRTRASERLYLLDASHIYKHIHKGIVDEDEMDLLLITDGEKKHYVLTVKPVLSGHLSKSRKSLPLFTVNLTSVERSPLLSGCGHPF